MTDRAMPTVFGRPCTLAFGWVGEGSVAARFPVRVAVLLAGSLLFTGIVAGQSPLPSAEERKEEALLFTAPGFSRPGDARWQGDGNMGGFSSGRTGEIALVVHDASTGRPTPCRVNVVGPDGHFYQPARNPLSHFALTGEWPRPGSAGNRVGKAPFRYVGRFFYMPGETVVRAPAGRVRIEVWKGLEFKPEAVTVELVAGARQPVTVTLTRTASMSDAGYHAGDSHLHLQRWNDEDERIAFDLLEAEGLAVGVTLAFNDPPGPYAAFMDNLLFPQRRLGRASIATRGGHHLVSGQEYRSVNYGHMNLILRDDLVAPGRSYDADTWPVFGEVARETVERGGFAFMAHGGYGREIYADAALGLIQGVELLQFGVYRDIGIEGWYDILNTGYRFPAHAASDYPPCRTMSDCRTYVHLAGSPTVPEWLAGLAAGRSFLTTGPLLLLEVDGEKPGARIHRTGAGPHRLNARVRVRCEVTTVTDIDLIVNGQVVRSLAVPREESRGRWIELSHPVELAGPAWIAARAHGKSPGGLPDAESHTNPVYVYVDNRAPFAKAAVDAWIRKIDTQLDFHARRSLADKAKVLNFFQRARDQLLRIRARGGLAADEDPARLASAAEGESGARGLALDGAAGAGESQIKAYLDAVAVPPTTPVRQLAALETLPGFRVELVAAEPLLRSPIVAAIDEDNRMYVGEMTDYPYNPNSPTRVAWQRGHQPGGKPLGAVRLLRDTDGDGVYDSSTVFADNLLWVGGIAPWKGGVFVTAPPDIWYLKDTDGDGVADVREKVFTGFAQDRQQGFVNSLTFSLDHRFHASTGQGGGLVRRADDPAAPSLGLEGHDLSFDPLTRSMERETGSRQFGLAFDDWGARFLCDQGTPGFHVVLPRRYLERNPWFTPRQTIARMAPSSTRVFRISPVEGWRHIKSSRRVAGTELPADIVPLAGAARLEVQRSEGVRDATQVGVSNHVIDAASGITVYRGGAYPPEFQGSLFVGDSLGNFVHRRVPVPAGAAYGSKRGDEGIEFLRTPDNWFRPVNFVNAPDGTLYVIDMGREYSESTNIPPDVEKQMDLRSGMDRGRIYRVAPEGFRSPPPPRLGTAATEQLVAALESPHGWWRDTAHRLIFERRDAAAAPALVRLVHGGSSPQARVHALWSLRGLGVLGDAEILRGLADAHGGVRENAVRLAEGRLDASAAVRDAVAAMVADPEPRVRLQVAFAVGESRAWNQVALLARLARENAADTWIQSAILSSAAECGGELLAAGATDPLLCGQEPGLDFLRQLATSVGFRNRPVEIARSLESISAAKDPAVALPLLNALGEGLRLAGTTVGAADAAGISSSLRRRAPELAVDGATAEPVRRTAIESLGLLTYAEAVPPLLALLAPGEPVARQLAAIKVLRAFPEPEVANVLLGKYAGLAAAARALAIDALLERRERAAALVVALGAKRIPRADLTVAQASALRQHGDAEVRERALEVLGVAGNAKRQDVYRANLPALDLTGNADRGRGIFASRCGACHQFSGVGLPFGPDLGGAGAGGRQKLLLAILDPNRDVAPEYFLQTVEMRDGTSVAGILRNETATSLTLLQVGGVTRTVAKANLAGRKIVRQSLMPEGLEGGLSHQDLADLIEFIVNPPVQ